MPHRSGRHFLQIPGPSNVPDRILRALHGGGPTIAPDWATALGTFLGRAAKIARTAGRELVTLVGETALGEALGARR